MAGRLAATFSELFTTLCNGRDGCPEDFPFLTNPSQQDSLLLAGAELPEPIHLPVMLSVWCVGAELLWLEGWLNKVSGFLANRSSLTSSTLSRVLDLSYMRTTNLSRIFMSASSMVAGYLLSLEKTEVASGNMFHVCQAVFFPLFLKAETTSQPVNAWKNSTPLAFSAPTLLYRLWIPIHRRLWPWPNASHSFSRPMSCRIGNILRPITRHLCHWIWPW